MRKKQSITDSAAAPRPTDRGLARLHRSLSESVAVVPATGVDASADLGARFLSVLNSLEGRKVSAQALFDTLKLETLDWGMDHKIEPQLLEAETPELPAESTVDEH